MSVIENIKPFLRENGLKWTGHIYKNSKNRFNEAKETDFEKLEEKTLIINFGDDGICGVKFEIDLMTFKVLGVDNHCPFTAYSGDDEQNLYLTEDRDLSEEWIKYQLQHSGLVYATLLKKKIEEKGTEISKDCERRVSQLTKKIEFLERSVEKIKEGKESQIRELNKYEKLIEDYNI